MSELRSFSNILVTGGSGFIGSNFIRYLFSDAGFGGRVVNLDALTYAGNPQNLADIAAAYPDRYVFIKGDIRDAVLVQKLFADYDIDAVVHFAAESHVDRSILDPQSFITTNIMGTYTLLEAARQAWKGRYAMKLPECPAQRASPLARACFSTTFRRTKCTGAWAKKAPSERPPPTTRARPIPPARRPATSWSKHMATPTAFP